jgi:uncharacterized membrane protein
MLRGIVMVLMALDHVRDFFTNATFQPLDLTQTNGWLFFTRWITHYCAPTFVFLAGVSAFLYGHKYNSKRDLSIFLLTRGLWIAILELTIVRLGWFFNFDYSLTVMQVIWAIGISMVCLSAIIFLPKIWVGIVGIVIVIGHDLLNSVSPESFGSLDWLWKLLHANGKIVFSNGDLIIVGYPIMPWFGIMCAGFGFGSIFLIEKEYRSKLLLWIGGFMVLTFIVLRAINVYGEKSPWEVQSTPFFTILSFINTSKYPPSLLYVLMTLGPAIVLLAFLEKWKAIVSDFFITIGKVPMFYYILHLFVIHGMAIMVGISIGADTSFLTNNTPPWSTERSFGFDLPVIYLIWVITIAILYPFCLWYMRFKAKHKDWKVLSYL